MDVGTAGLLDDQIAEFCETVQAGGEVRVTCTIWPLVLPTAAMKSLAASAVATSAAVKPYAESFLGSSHARREKYCPPRISAVCTPGTACSLGYTTRCT